MKRNPIKKIFAFSLFFFLVQPFLLYSQVPSQKEQLRIQIWAELDAFPGSFEKEDTDTAASQNNSKGMYSFAIQRAKEVAPFLIAGMLDGWTFDYVPYDKARKVSEIFDFGEVRAFNPKVNTIEYKEPKVDENRLLCWAYCDRTPSQQLSYERWASIVHPRISGHGASSVEDGFEGIKAACENAVKDAVREYWRTMSKNKPKEIYGTVLLIDSPRIYISEGQYVVDLDFFLKTDRIVLYSYF